MSKKLHECSECGRGVVVNAADYRYRESGLSNLILHTIERANCPPCGNVDAFIPHIERLH